MTGLDTGLEGRCAVITGASRGLGFGIAQRVVEAGGSVVITSRDQDEIDAAAKELGDRAVGVAAHAARDGEAERAVGIALERFGRVDMLVNNVGTNPYAGRLIDVDDERWDKTLRTNLTTPLVWSRAAWRGWMSEHGGVMLNMSSFGALTTSPVLGVYGVSKAALLALTRQLAVELAPKVRVNALLPALVKTDFARAVWERDTDGKFAGRFPLKRLGEIDDIASAALFLLSDASSWTTGQLHVVDGGAGVTYPRI